MVFHFDMVYAGMGTVRKYIPEPFDLRHVKTALAKWQRFIQDKDIWTTLFAENHDSARSISRFASDASEDRVQSSKVLELMLTTHWDPLYLPRSRDRHGQYPARLAAGGIQGPRNSQFLRLDEEKTKNDPK